MRRKKDIVVDEEEKFKIPMIEFTDQSLIRKRDKFERSEAVSPFHGSNVLDRQAFIDNSGGTDVDFSYDFVREKKHISKEELIKKYGTEYYEFNVKATDQELYQGADYTKKTEPKAVKEEKKKSFSFVETIEEAQNDTLASKPAVNVQEEKPEEPSIEETDIYDENTDFSLNIEIDDNDNYSYNSFDEKLEKPTPKSIPTFMVKDKKEEPQEEADMTLEENFTFGDIPVLKTPNITFDDDIVDTNIEMPKANNVENARMEANNCTRPEANNYNSYDEVTSKPAINKYQNYRIPVETIFKKSPAVSNEVPDWLLAKKDVIDNALRSFGIDGKVVEFTKGPAFTRYEILLASGVNVKKVPQITDNLQAALEVKSLRIQAPIPGKGTVGIETPNDVLDTVCYGDVLTEDFLNTPKNLSVALGKNIDGTPVIQNIDDMPHALIAGATKSGKSVCINTIIISLLIKNSPDNLKLILVDPKKVELGFYNDLPHLATPVINDSAVATEALKWCVTEMDRRFDVFARSRVKTLVDYNKKRKEHPEYEKIPFIVIIIDEFNDLVMTSGQEVQDYIIRLAQKARACGIHVILATQRPTVKVVNGTIKANVPCRIAFRVASQVDSSTILDEVGAESLLGRGDMLIKNESEPIRAQGAFVSDDEIEAVCDYLVNKYEPDYLFTHEDLKRSMRSSGGASEANDAPSESDSFLYEIAKFCVETNTCSVNSIQNNFSLGFNRASRIVSMLEDRKIVSTKNGTKAREILVDSYQLRDIFHIDD